MTTVKLSDLETTDFATHNEALSIAAACVKVGCAHAQSDFAADPDFDFDLDSGPVGYATGECNPLEDLQEILADVDEESLSDLSSAIKCAYNDELSRLVANEAAAGAGAPTKCEDCGHVLKLEVLRSNSNAAAYVGAEFYIGAECYCGPYSRESGYYRTYKQAERDLVSGEYYLQ